MLRFFIALAILCLCLAIGYSINALSGEVVILVGDTIVQTSLVLWGLLSLVGAWLVVLCIRLLIFIWRSPQYFNRSSEVRKRNKAHKHLQEGLAELISGHYQKAEKHFVHGGDLADEIGESSVIYFENAAIAADYLNAEDRRKRYLLRARQRADSKQHTALTRLNEAELYIDHGEYNKAIPLLEEIQKQEGKNVKILTLLVQAYINTNAWEKAWRILPKLRDYMSEEDYKHKQKTCAQGMLKDTPAIESANQLKSAWDGLPNDIRQEQDMKLLYAGALVENGHNDAAEKYLTQEIKKNHDLALIQAYSQLRSGNFKGQLSNMKQWESAHPNDALFLYAKALVAYKAKAYDLASQAIEASLQRHPSKEAFALWAQILEAKNQPEAALAAYRQSIIAVAMDKTLDGDLLPAGHDHKALQKNA